MPTPGTSPSAVLTALPRRAPAGLIAAVLLALLCATLLVAPSSPARAAAPPTSAAADWEALEARAAQHGSVPVVVQTDVRTRPEHTLPEQARAAQQREVRGVSDEVLAALGRSPRGLKTADNMPLLAFSATVEDLRRLQRSPRVVAVSEDRAHELDDVRGGGAPGRAGTTTPGTVEPPGGSAPAPAGTSANGSSSALPQWWDYYRIGADRALAAGWTGAGQTVAVLDTGVDRNHNWLAGDVVNETCFSAAAHCPNGRTKMFGFGAAAPCTYSADCGHGTHVAHTAAGYYGVASGARILASQVFSRGATGRPTYYESDLVWALSHVYNVRGSYRIAAVNMSLGGYLYRGYCDNTSDGTVPATYLTGWINTLKSVGIPTVVSSGNNNSAVSTLRPACIANSVSVGNTTLTPGGADAVFGYVSYGSNSNATVDLLAPGTDICSAVPGNRFDCGYIGTSMAAPHVAGAMAVLRQKRGGITVDSMVSALRLSGLGVVDSRNGINRSRINVWGALGRI